MKKVVHFGKYYYPDYGGIESVTHCLATRLHTHGYNVAVVCFGSNFKVKIEIIESIKVVRAPKLFSIARQPIGFLYFFHCLREAKNADLIHIHAPNLLAAFSILFLDKKTKILVHWHSDILNKGILGFLVKPLQLALLKKADKVVATSPTYASFSKILKFYTNKISVIPIGISDMSASLNCSRVENDLRQKLSEKKIILSVGRLVLYKGFDYLIDATRYMPNDVVVVIVGDGPLRVKLENKINSKGLMDKVLLIGKICNETLHQLFKSASLFCLPSISRAEAFGVVLLEAMSMGLPLVTTKIPGSGVSWVNLDEVSGLNVPICDPLALSKACNKILLSSEFRKKLSNGARQRFLTYFTEKIFIDSIKNEYNNILQSKNSY